MPKETTIPVSKKTLKFVNEYKKEFAFKSLDEAVINSVRWARLFAYIDSEQRRSVVERISNLESHRIEDLHILKDTRDRLKALEAKIKS